MWILFLASVSVSRSLFTLKIFKLLSRTKFLIGYVMCLFNSFWLADDDDDEELKSTTKDTLTIAIVVLVAIVVYILRMYVCMYIECSVTLPVENTKENSSLASSSSSFSSTTAAVYPSGHPEAVLIPRQKQIIWKKNIFDDIQNLWFWRKLCGAYVSMLFIYWLSVVKPSIWDQSLNIVFADVRKKNCKGF